MGWVKVKSHSSYMGSAVVFDMKVVRLIVMQSIQPAIEIEQRYNINLKSSSTALVPPDSTYYRLRYAMSTGSWKPLFSPPQQETMMFVKRNMTRRTPPPSVGSIVPVLIVHTQISCHGWWLDA